MQSNFVLFALFCVCTLFVVESLPLNQFAEDLVHCRVLLASVLQNLFNDLVALTLLFKVLTGLFFRNLGLELVYIKGDKWVRHMMTLFCQLNVFDTYWLRSDCSVIPW